MSREGAYVILARREPPPSEIDYVEEVGEYGDFPEYPNTASMLGMRRLARDRGCRVMLTGQGGDE